MKDKAISGIAGAVYVIVSLGIVYLFDKFEVCCYKGGSR